MFWYSKGGPLLATDIGPSPSGPEFLHIRHQGTGNQVVDHTAAKISLWNGPTHRNNIMFQCDSHYQGCACTAAVLKCYCLWVQPPTPRVMKPRPAARPRSGEQHRGAHATRANHNGAHTTRGTHATRQHEGAKGQTACNYAQDRLGYVDQQKQVAKTTNTKHTNTNKEPPGARIFLLKGKEGTWCDEPTPTPPTPPPSLPPPHSNTLPRHPMPPRTEKIWRAQRKLGMGKGTSKGR